MASWYLIAHHNIHNGAIAQLGERLNGIQEVSGSIPLSSTTHSKGYCMLQYPFSNGR